MRNLILTLTLLACARAGACSGPLDCAIGSTCVKQPGSMYGYCAGGMQPGNSNDAVPVYNPNRPQNNVGGTCSWDTDCGFGGHCLKQNGNLYGVCQ